MAAMSQRSVEEGQTLRYLAGRGTAEEFFAVYRPSDATEPDLGIDLLAAALAHKDPAARPVIAGQLLDDGADPAWELRHGSTTLHVLLGQKKHDIPGEARLLRRLLEGGADVNRVLPKFGTPLETLAEQFKFSDAELAPFYDELFARPDLDLLQTGNFGNSVLDNIRRAAELRVELLARAEAYLAARGIAVPPPAR